MNKALVKETSHMALVLFQSIFKISFGHIYLYTFFKWEK